MTGACDVFVAGAGPAGSLTALLLARRGLRVVLADRDEFPREKVCGCCLSGAALAALRAAGLGALPDRLGARELRRVVIAAGGDAATLPLPAGRALSRTALDAELVREAAAAGARFLPGVTARLGEPGSDGIRIRLGGGDEVRARVAVAADGLAGTFLADRPELAPVTSPASRIGAGAVLDAAAPLRPGAVHLAVADSGYVGMVRLEDGRLDVAACLDPRAVRETGGPGPAVARVLERAGGPAVAGIASASFRGTPPLTRRRPDVASERLFVVGDAAGYVEPFTGEGIGWALSGATALAPLAARAARSRRPEWATRWRDRHRAAVRRRQATCRAVAALLRRPRLVRAALRVLGRAPSLARPVLGRLNRPAPEAAA